ncbi:MAG: ankyrin repeat domain-containing protein, partial [Bacteroidota bacterium]
MEPYVNFSDPIGMIKRGVEDLIDLRRESYESKLEFLARFEKAAAWASDTWTYWDFETAPVELARLKAANLSYREVCRRCDEWLKKNEESKPELIRLIETGEKTTIMQEVKKLVEAGADPDEASLLKDTALEAARYQGYEDVFDYLIHSGANGEKDGFSRLHRAVRYGDLADVKPLIGSFDILWRGFAKTSVLHEAVISEKTDVLSALLEEISRAGQLDHEEVAHCCSLAVSLGNVDMLSPFLERGIEADLGLDATLQNYDTTLLKTLLERGADVHEISDLNIYHDDPLKVRDANGNPAITEYVRTL